MDTGIAVLVVTYNRLEKLKKCLLSYSNQTLKPKMIYIVDNCSTDGTKEFLYSWKNKSDVFVKKVITLEKNCGGSGGFYEGMKAVMNEEFEWLWISDDDAYPESNAFQELNKYKDSDYSVICSSVITDEGIDFSHRKVLKNDKNYFGNPVSSDYYKLESFDISIFSFVGTSLRKEVINKCGLPIKDYFIWFDDTEYSMRVNKFFKILCVPKIKVYHDTIIEKHWKYSWKTYYGERNKLYTLKKHLSSKEFKRYIIHYKLGMAKHLFTDYKYFLSQKDGYKDFKNNILGVPKDHMPGIYKY